MESWKDTIDVAKAFSRKGVWLAYPKNVNNDRTNMIIGLRIFWLIELAQSQFTYLTRLSC